MQFQTRFSHKERLHKKKEKKKSKLNKEEKKLNPIKKI